MSRVLEGGEGDPTLDDLSEFDDGYYRLSNDGRWEPDHLPSWLADDTDYPFIIRTPRGRVGFGSGECGAKPTHHAGRRLST